MESPVVGVAGMWSSAVGVQVRGAAKRVGTAAIIIERKGDQFVVGLTGNVVVANVESMDRDLRGIESGHAVDIDLSRVEALDTAGAWLLVALERRLAAEGREVRLAGVSPAQAALIETVRQNLPEPVAEAPGGRGLVAWFDRVGRQTAAGFGVFVEILSFMGLVIVRQGSTLFRPRRWRFISLVYHMQEAGLNAVPIVALMSFLIGIVLAFQGSSQLRQFGAEVFVVDLIAISLLRELGILLTAIIVAGRSASAFTAAIGSMKLNEEIDAMRTLGLDPVEVLVLPRVLALVFMLPILGLVADLAGLIGGALMSWVELGISPGMFRTRLVENTDVQHFLVGIAKAPFFAVIIGIIGCYQGLKVESSAESLGGRTSKSVVMAIFMVIVVDALFSIFFATLGV
jgi:phospholipid/cholesterol/gamma-HCH transport system permease protein